MIVVTGGAGFIGSALAVRLNAMGRCDLLITDRRGQSAPKAANLKKLSFAEYLEADDFIGALEGKKFDGRIEAIFHQGACSSTTETDTEYLKNNNTLYTLRLAEWCVREKAYFSYASSAAVYGAGERGYSDDDKLTPQLKPLNPYGRSKLDFDVMAIQKGLVRKIAGFRFFNVYGPNEYHKEDMRSLVHKGFGQIQQTGKLRLFKSYKKEYPDGGQKRDFVYVKDAVEAVLWFWKNPRVKGIFNIGAGRAQTWNDLAEGLFSAMCKKRNIEYFDMPDSIRNQYQYFTEADLSKLRGAGCDVEFRDLKAGVEDYVRNYLLTEDPHL